MDSELILHRDEANAVIWGDHDDWEGETPTDIIEHTRWAVILRRVFKHLPTGKFYSLEWWQAATEYQDQDPFNWDDEVQLTEVVPLEVTVTQWQPVESS